MLYATTTTGNIWCPYPPPGCMLPLWRRCFHVTRSEFKKRKRIVNTKALSSWSKCFEPASSSSRYFPASTETHQANLYTRVLNRDNNNVRSRRRAMTFGISLPIVATGLSWDAIDSLDSTRPEKYTFRQCILASNNSKTVHERTHPARHDTTPHTHLFFCDFFFFFFITFSASLPSPSFHRKKPFVRPVHTHFAFCK